MYDCYHCCHDGARTVYVDKYEADPLIERHSAVWLSCGHWAEAWHRYCPHCGGRIEDYPTPRRWRRDAR